MSFPFNRYIISFRRSEKCYKRVYIMSDDIIYVDSYDFDVRIEHGITAVLFFTEWCVQSRGIMPFLEEIADDYYDYMRVLALDIEQSPDIAAVFAIDVTPTVIIFKDGKMVERITGANPPRAYTDIIDELIS